MPRTTKSTEERRQEIINTARELFIENGFDKTQAADISKEMKVAQGLIYHYFQSKTDILYAVIDQFIGKELERTKNILEESTGTALDRLVLFFQKDRYPEHCEKLPPSFISDPAMMDYCSKKMIVSMKPILISLIESGNLDGSWNCEYPAESAAFILQGISGLAKFEDRKKPPCKPDLQSSVFMNILLRVLGTKP
ncbi:MAG: TetR/AcrR family transcriptional regulator [Clostridium sp.]|jgi:AcrR family transcriptional regulator|nr:TetR/AcrR family transcriptional regulator [Clostridium sp.]